MICCLGPLPITLLQAGTIGLTLQKDLLIFISQSFTVLLCFRFSYPWQDTMDEMREYVASEVYITHPVLTKLLYHFETK